MPCPILSLIKRARALPPSQDTFTSFFIWCTWGPHMPTPPEQLGAANCSQLHVGATRYFKGAKRVTACESAKNGNKDSSNSGRARHGLLLPDGGGGAPALRALRATAVVTVAVAPLRPPILSRGSGGAAAAAPGGQPHARRRPPLRISSPPASRVTCYAPPLMWRSSFTWSQPDW
jgi:hypothetical protein